MNHGQFHDHKFSQFSVTVTKCHHGHLHSYAIILKTYLAMYITLLYKKMLTMNSLSIIYEVIQSHGLGQVTEQHPAANCNGKKNDLGSARLMSQD